MTSIDEFWDTNQIGAAKKEVKEILEPIDVDYVALRDVDASGVIFL